MAIRKIAALLYILAGSVALGAESEVRMMVGPPELGAAVVVDGRTIEVRRFVERMVIRTTTSNVLSGVKIEVKAGSIEPVSRTEVVPVVETHVTRIDATRIVARRVDGRAVSTKVLLDELAKPTPVILTTHDQQIDPLFLRIFKPEALVLVLAPPSAAPPPTVIPAFTPSANRSNQRGRAIKGGGQSKGAGLIGRSKVSGTVLPRIIAEY